ncbi:unnamed protein product [Schistosoma margrebowiei]|uniref:Uncharacterized protein n=1 Tax=Schistosoma margrebowiei TaxID=48269 RepID=A0A183LJ37_9TREM|nr:unnamed protein product [Schistosoma margrebowiei]
MVGGSQQETLDLGFMQLGTRQQGVPVLFLREVMLPDRFDPVSSSDQWHVCQVFLTKDRILSLLTSAR